MENSPVKKESDSPEKIPEEYIDGEDEHDKEDFKDAKSDGEEKLEKETQ